jgi:hypothetical protein
VTGETIVFEFCAGVAATVTMDVLASASRRIGCSVAVPDLEGEAVPAQWCNTLPTGLADHLVAHHHPPERQQSL